MIKLNIYSASSVRTYGDVIKVEWRNGAELCASAIYGTDGSYQGSQVHGGNYEVPNSISDFIKEII